VSTNSGVYLKKKFLALGNRDALHENANFRRAAFVDLAVDDGECFGLSGDPASCVVFLREDLVDEISQQVGPPIYVICLA
jgi:hypothetical protein